ncbi:FAD-dependent hydroxylase [Myxosarcina sp. GI1]|uniref:FAD-dependent hydroxylase n=1 Tax=Myxosarcina sp. GI1 TaxID=1541065 RepID=UPI000563759B|nr:FAD-dependent hydroxylase [Myxosarcina sp. GI1]
MLLEQIQSRPQNHNFLESDLVIVGGGIVGATLASALKDSGLKIIIIEAKTLASAAAKQQAYAFSLLSSRIYQKIGVWDEIFPYIGKFSQIDLSDGDRISAVKFNTQDLDTEHLGYVAQHNIVLTALQNYLNTDCPNVSWLCPAEVIDVEINNSAATVEVKIDGKSQFIKTNLVIGADGARSRLRALAKIKTHGWKYWQSCVAFTVKHTAPQNDIAFEKFHATGPMGILPLPENHCQIVWTNPHGRAKALQQLEATQFLAELQRHTGGVLGNLQLTSDRFLFPVQLMQCDRYIERRLALVGDAAHCCHPVGGQGLNLGIRDAATLAEILTVASQQGRDIGDRQVLKRYQNWRKLENLAVLGFTDLLDRMFSNNWLPIVIIRRSGLWLMNNVKPLKVFALKFMTGLTGKTPQLAQR